MQNMKKHGNNIDRSSSERFDGMVVGAEAIFLIECRKIYFQKVAIKQLMKQNAIKDSFVHWWFQ